ncbi:MAG: sulfatase-like hydrolase/transferase [Candidatus Omnitrophica bacterium]|nr:sulfatase-like hydrolase/transferase [Candidatus Omnitrophota bacterium]MCM8802035.1 sulfatase-like hydrolase/transferase [Candidatus Omnitrophota bacterium]
MNLIFIMIDSLRQDHVSIYNKGKKVFENIESCKTPNIDKFSKNSVIFDNVYPCGLPTIPVRYELMTGFYSLPYRPWCPLTNYDLTIAQILNREGYISGLITDTYHYRKHDMNYHRGFHIYEWIRGQEYDPYKVPITKRNLDDYLNENYPEEWRWRVLQFLANTDDMDEKNWFTMQVVEKSVDFLKNARKTNKRIFLWIDSFEPHEPWDPPEKFDTYTSKNYKGKRLIMPMGGLAEKWATKEEIDFIRGLYAGEVSFVDYCFGFLFDELERMNFYEDSLIILTADHGHPLCDHGKFLKGSDRMYSELLKVPFIMKFPKELYKGKIDALIQFPDVLPTIFEILGFENNNIPLAGKSFFSIIKGDKDKHRNAVISGYKNGIYRCVRNKEWSLILTPEDEVDYLFNIKEDPKETKNLIDKNQEIAKELLKEFGTVFFEKKTKTIKGIQGEYELSSASIE